MKVLQVLEPGCDGVFRHVETLVAFLRAAGAEVDLAYSSVRPSAGLTALIERMTREGARTVDLRVGPGLCFADLPAAARLIRLCRSKRYDVVHAHSSKAGGLVRLLSPVLKADKIFYTPNAYFGMNRNHDIRTRIYTLAERLLASVGTTINVSIDEAEFGRRFLKLQSGKSKIIPNSVDSNWFVPATSVARTRARREFAVSSNQILIGYASRFSPQKDPLVALESFRQCALTNPRLHLLYLCKGSLLADAHAFLMEAGIVDRVTFADYREDVRSFYHSLDLFLLTSRYEAGWPFVIIEAMSCGLPLVTSVCSGMSDVTAAGLTHCWTFQVGSVDGCVAALKAAVQTDTHTKSNHRLIVENRFSSSACFGKLLGLYAAPAADGNATVGRVALHDHCSEERRSGAYR